MSTHKYLEPGRYVHKKGGTYLLLLVAENCEHNGEGDVFYVPLSPERQLDHALRREVAQGEHHLVVGHDLIVDAQSARLDLTKVRPKASRLE